MESYLNSNDSEELFRVYGIVERENAQATSSLAGIVEAYELAKACLVQDTIDTIRYCRNINNGKDGIYGACQGGHKELALLLFEKYGCDPNWGLIGACQGGNKELALLMIQKIESIKGKVDLDGGLYGACSGNQKEMAILMIEKGATDFEGGLGRACVKDNRELISLMIHYGAIICIHCWGLCIDHAVQKH
jgi:hypothetical protein